MRFQIRYADSLSIIHDKDPSWKDLAFHFTENGYDPLYVYKNGYISYVVTFKDFSMRKINVSLNRAFIKEYSENIQNSDVEKSFLEDLDADRIIYIKDGKVVCEANALIELPIQNAVAKNLMALRYVKFFHNEMSVYLEQFDSILILAEYDVYSYLHSVFPNKNMIHAESIQHGLSIVKEQNTEICFDFILSKKIRTILASEIGTFVDLCKVLTPFALQKLVQLSNERNISLMFYKLPRYQDLSCLHEREMDNYYNRKTIGQLINDNSYSKLFTDNEKEMQYLRNKEYQASQRLDNGYCFVMDYVVSDSLNVYSEIRSNGCIESEGSIVNFYGPCTAYGLFTEDRLTVSGLIQYYAVKDGKSFQIHNRAGIHGDNELNSIMQALMVPVVDCDTHVFLDVLEDLPYDEYPQISFVKNWFNSEKSCKEIQFLDFPGHCNAGANRIMAKHIFEDLTGKYENSEITEERKPLLMDSFDPLEIISFTHSSFVKQRRILKKFNIDKNIEGNVAVLVITGQEKFQSGKKIIDECLLQCDFLYVLFINANIKNINENKRIHDYVMSLDSAKIKGIPLEYFFYVNRYYNVNKGLYESMKQAIFVKLAFFKLINDELSVNTYFCHRDIADCFLIDSVKNAFDDYGWNFKIKKVQGARDK